MDTMRVRIASVGIADGEVFDDVVRLAIRLAPQTTLSTTDWVDYLVSSVCYRIATRAIEGGPR